MIYCTLKSGKRVDSPIGLSKKELKEYKEKLHKCIERVCANESGAFVYKYFVKNNL